MYKWCLLGRSNGIEESIEYTLILVYAVMAAFGSRQGGEISNYLLCSIRYIDTNAILDIGEHSWTTGRHNYRVPCAKAYMCHLLFRGVCLLPYCHTNYRIHYLLLLNITINI